MKEKIFDNPLSVFQENVNNIMKDQDQLNLIKELIKLQMFKNSEKSSSLLQLIEIYNYLGIDKFMGVMDILAGKTIKFPKKNDFKETVEVAICYYYHQVENYSWDKIKEMISDDEFQVKKMSIKVDQLQKFIYYYEEKMTSKMFKEKDHE